MPEFFASLGAAAIMFAGGVTHTLEHPPFPAHMDEASSTASTSPDHGKFSVRDLLGLGHKDGERMASSTLASTTPPRMRGKKDRKQPHASTTPEHMQRPEMHPMGSTTPEHADSTGHERDMHPPMPFASSSPSHADTNVPRTSSDEHKPAGTRDMKMGSTTQPVPPAQMHGDMDPMHAHGDTPPPPRPSGTH